MTKESKPPITEDEFNEFKRTSETTGKGFRGIRDETYNRFGVRHRLENGEVYEQIYVITQDGTPVGLKIREVPKNFRSVARTGSECDLFMQFRFQRGGKYLLITEGELDALSAYQMMHDYNHSRGQTQFETAVVSATIGAKGVKQYATNYEFINRFDIVVLAMDNDKAGQEAIDDVVKALPKGKVRIMKMRYKDPNEYLIRGEQKSFVADFYDAQPYVPVGVLGSGELYDKILGQAKVPRVSFPPFMAPLNDMFAGGLPLGHIVNIAAGTGLGKCFERGTMIRMADLTVKPVEEITNGDYVLGADLKPKKVIGVNSGFDTMYTIDQVKGVTYTVNSEHILSLKASSNIPSLRLVKNQVMNISVVDYVKLTKSQQRLLKGYKPTVNEPLTFDKHEYTIGLWLAEGSRGKPSFTLANKDQELISYLDAYASENNYAVTVYDNDRQENCTTYNLTGGFKSVLRGKGILDDKCLTQGYISNLTYSQRMSLLAGFIDGDGYTTDNVVTMTLQDNLLSENIVVLARLCGFAVTTKLVNKTWQNGKGLYRYISISGDLERLPNVLSRKKCSVRKQVKNHLNTGITVSVKGEGEYFGFEIDCDNKLFCLEDFTVVHNTSFVNEIIYYWIFNSPHRIGIVSMELDAGQYGESMLSRHLSRKLALIGNDEEKQKLLESDHVKNKAHELFMNGEEHRFYLLDNRDGSIEEIQNTIEELVISCGCKIIVLDPLQDILDGLTNEEQTVFMKWCKGIIKSHGVTLILINHMRKSSDGNHTEEDIHGSSTIIKSASANILLKRDKTADDHIERNTTYVTLTKNRICGMTGPAGAVYYDNETHTLHDKETYFGQQTI